MRVLRACFGEKFTEKLKLTLDYLSEYYDILYDRQDDGAEELNELINFIAEAIEKNGAKS